MCQSSSACVHEMTAGARLSQFCMVMQESSNAGQQYESVEVLQFSPRSLSLPRICLTHDWLETLAIVQEVAGRPFQ